MSVLPEALRELLRLPGSRYSCVADPVTGAVVAELGSAADSGARGAILSWGGEAARHLAAAAEDDLEDLMITSRRAYHLVRQVESGSGDRLLVYLCLDRVRGNLAAARREVAALRLDGSAPARPAPPSVPAPVPAPVPPQASPPAAERISGPLFTRPPPGVWVPSSASDPRPALRPTAVPPTAGPLPAVPQPAVSQPPAVPRPRPRPDVPVPGAAVGDPGAPAELPRRAPVALPPPPPPPPAASTGRGWANDLGTMRRLLAGLRNLA